MLWLVTAGIVTQNNHNISGSSSLLVYSHFRAFRNKTWVRLRVLWVANASWVKIWGKRWRYGPTEGSEWHAEIDNFKMQNVDESTTLRIKAFRMPPPKSWYGFHRLKDRKNAIVETRDTTAVLRWEKMTCKDQAGLRQAAGRCSSGSRYEFNSPPSEGDRRLTGPFDIQNICDALYRWETRHCRQGLCIT